MVPADAVPDAPEMVWILEAESFTSRLMPAVHQWTAATTFSGYSGASYMHLVGGDGAACVTNVGACASMTYAITLLTGGAYHFHARMYANPGGSTDSVWVSVDDPAAAALANVAVMDDSTWRWSTSGQSYILPAGNHTLHIWHREGGANVDKLALIESATPPP